MIQPSVSYRELPCLLHWLDTALSTIHRQQRNSWRAGLRNMPRTFSRLENTRNRQLGAPTIAQEIPRKSYNTTVASNFSQAMIELPRTLILRRNIEIQTALRTFLGFFLWFFFEIMNHPLFRKPIWISQLIVHFLIPDSNVENLFKKW